MSTAHQLSPIVIETKRSMLLPPNPNNIRIRNCTGIVLILVSQWVASLFVCCNPIHEHDNHVCNDDCNNSIAAAEGVQQQQCISQLEEDIFDQKSDEQYEELAAVLKHHYDEYSESKVTSDNHSYNHINLSPKVDSSLVRSQAYKSNNTRLSLNVQNLTRVIRVNLHENSVTAQARCTYDNLVKETMKYHVIPVVVPEFKSITVGGAIVGGALESTSYMYGQVSDTVLSMQVLLANGTRTTVTPHTHPDLFHGIPGSYGSLVVVLEATLRVRPIASSVVTLRATTYSSIQDGINELLDLVVVSVDESMHQNPDPKFVDAIQYPSGEFVIITADFLYPPAITSPFISTETTRSKWFYEVIYDLLPRQSNLKVVEPLPPVVINMPIYDYLFRYERGAFWMGRPLQFSWTAIWKNPLLIVPFIVSWHRTRFVFGKFFTATILYRLLHQLDSDAVAEKFMIQDAYLPSENVTQFIQYIRHNIPLSVPIWVCPVKRPQATQPLSPSGNFDSHTVENNFAQMMLINVGLWGRVSDRNAIQYMKQIEDRMISLGGRKMLYSISGASQMSAETLYTYHINGTAYHELREKYSANGIFTPLHEKLQLVSDEKLLSGSTPHHSNHHGWKYWLSRYLL
jgi:Delta24-sterol reductase